MYGVSLTDLIEARRGQDLLDYIDGLPSASRTREAILNDPDAVQELALLPEPDGDDWSPRVSEWTLAHALQYDQRSILVAIKQLLETQVTRKRPKPVEPLPAPRTLLDEARQKVRRARVEDLKYAFGYRPPEND